LLSQLSYRKLNRPQTYLAAIGEMPIEQLNPNASPYALRCIIDYSCQINGGNVAAYLHLSTPSKILADIRTGRSGAIAKDTRPIRRVALITVIEKSEFAQLSVVDAAAISGGNGKGEAELAREEHPDK